jgi:curli biogenesis system outer membrane secretion channel CsgG
LLSRHTEQIKILSPHSQQTCKLCNEHIETQQHFLSCPQQEDHWEKMIQRALLDDQGNSTHQQLNQMLTCALTKCRTQTETFDIHAHTNFETLIQEQSTIGSDRIIKGRWSTAWVQLYDTINRRKEKNMPSNKFHQFGMSC